MNRIHIHFDGDIAVNHQISMRTLGKTLTHLQNAMDRAYLDNKYGKVWKHARMNVADYEESMFLVEAPQEGGYILEFLANNHITKAIVDRLASALRPAIEQAKSKGIENVRNINQEIETRIAQINNNIISPKDFESLIENPGDKILRKYGDRTITKEIDQILSIIRSGHAGESYFELEIYGSLSHQFTFTKELSKSFHSVVSRRELGDPVLYKAKVLQLDFANKHGKIKNIANDKKAVIHFANEASFMIAKEFLGVDNVMHFIGCPMIEYGAFDPQAGDIYFIELSENG